MKTKDSKILEKLFNSPELKKFYEQQNKMKEHFKKAINKFQESNPLFKPEADKKEISLLDLQNQIDDLIHQLPEGTEKEKGELARILNQTSQKLHFENNDFNSLYTCADEMQKRTNQGSFETFREAYRFAVDEGYTINGKPLKNWNQLEKAYNKF